jgi:hypothetical protein
MKTLPEAKEFESFRSLVLGSGRVDEDLGYKECCYIQASKADGDKTRAE